MNKMSLFRSYGFAMLVRRGMCKAPPETDVRGSMSARYKPSELQKFILVLTKKYKSKEEIPKYVSAEVIDRSRSEARIKLSNLMMLLTALASFGAIMAGKNAAKRGESVQQMNLDWHKKYQEDFKETNEAPK